MASPRNGTPKSDFPRTFVHLAADQGRSTTWALAGALLILGAWLCWAMWARISLYEVSLQARIELDSATYPIESPVEGRVVQCRLQVGQQVHRGDALIELDAQPAQLDLNQEEVRERTLGPQLDRLRSQIAAEQLAKAEEQKSSQLSLQEANDRIREARIATDFSERELARIRKLHTEKLLSDRDLEKAEGESAKLRAVEVTLQSAAIQIPQEQATRDRERDIKLQQLEEQIAKLEAQQASAKAAIGRLGYEVERRQIRAAVDGRIGEAATLRVGAVVKEGEKLGSVIPSGHLLVIAQYPAEAAFGRIHAGQVGTLRLEGFPWAEFGTVSATVTRVAQEVREGKVRVELAVDANSSFRGHLQHGMPGTLEIAVERLSPLALVSRTAGQWLTAHP